MLSSALPTRDVGLFDFTLRYQRTPCAKYHVRPLSLLQQEVLYRCDGMVTVADLADMTRYTHPEIRAVLGFLSQHGLIKTLPPDPTLFAPRPQASAPFPSRPRDGRKRRGPGGWNDRLWRWLTWDVQRR